MDIDMDIDIDKHIAVDHIVYKFCIVLIKQKVIVNEYINLLLHFTAILGIDRIGIAWKGTNDFTGRLAGIVWYTYIMILEYFFEHLPEDPAELTIEALEAVLDEY